MTIQKPPSQPGCAWVTECIEICTTTAVYVEEQGVRATFRNPKRRRVRKIHFDGCYFPEGSGRRADFIVSHLDRVDVIVELKGSDSNLTGRSGAVEQVENTLQAWKTDELRSSKIAALVVYGRISASKKLPGRIPGALAERSALEGQFLKRHRILLLIHEHGERQYSFNEFLRKSDAR